MKMLLMGKDEFLLTGAFGNAQNAVNKVAKSKPDVIVMDIKMPEVSGIQAVREIKAVYPEVPILMQTVFEDDNNVFAAICAGASGYILKGSSPTKIIDAIMDAHTGGSPMTPSIARKVLTLFQTQYCYNNNFYDLSAREKDILKYLMEGYSYKLIADTCNISYHTVNAHLRKIYTKLQVNSAQEAISKVFMEKLIPPRP